MDTDVALDRLGLAALATVPTAIATLAIVGITTCVIRDRAFEDECRRAGGIIVASSVVTPVGAGISHDTCGAFGVDGKLRPIPLPNYRKSS